MSEQRLDTPTYEYIAVDDAIELRALDDNDAPRLFELTDSNREYLGQYLPWVDATRDLRDSRLFIDETRSKRAAGQEYGFGIVVLGQLVGHISLMHLRDGHMPEIGYWVAESVSGRGITTKAAAAVTDFGFSTLGLDRILIRARDSNLASNRVAQKLGYQLEGPYLNEYRQAHNHWIKQNPQTAQG